MWDPPNPTQFRLFAAQSSAKPAANFVPFRPAKPVGRERGVRGERQKKEIGSLLRLLLLFSPSNRTSLPFLICRRWTEIDGEEPKRRRRRDKREARLSSKYITWEEGHTSRAVRLEGPHSAPFSYSRLCAFFGFAAIMIALHAEER